MSSQIIMTLANFGEWNTARAVANVAYVSVMGSAVWDDSWSVKVGPQMVLSLGYH